TASVSLTPSGFPPLQENVNGVYAFPALPSGAYSLEITAPGFLKATHNVSIADGELVSLTLPLSKPENPEPPRSLFDCFNDRTRMAGSDASVFALALFALALFKRRF